MAKTHSQFVCQRCGRITTAYVGKCPQCGEFGTMVEQIIAAASTNKSSRARSLTTTSKVQRLSSVEADGVARMSLPNDEFSRVLGGGVVPGSLILVGGEPGIGKSTLLLQVASLVAGLHG